MSTDVTNGKRNNTTSFDKPVPKWLFYRFIDFLFIEEKHELQQYRLHTFRCKPLHLYAMSDKVARQIEKQMAAQDAARAGVNHNGVQCEEQQGPAC